MVDLQLTAMRHGFTKRFWVVSVLLLVALAAAHGVALYRFASRFTWTILVGLVVLVLLTHSGILCSFYAVFVRRFSHKP